MRLSYILVLFGIVVMFLGSSATLFPLATVQVGPVQIVGISPLSATLIGVGAVIFLAGVGLYLKGR